MYTTRHPRLVRGKNNFYYGAQIFIQQKIYFPFSKYIFLFPIFAIFFPIFPINPKLIHSLVYYCNPTGLLLNMQTSLLLFTGISIFIFTQPIDANGKH